MENSINAEEKHKSLDFIQQIVEKDLKEGKNGGRLQTRFPPEAICISATPRLSAKISE